jgi:hypothetical protein
MAIIDTYKKIVELCAATSGIASAPEALPLALPEAGLPLALVVVGSATWNEHARGLYRQVRNYTIEVYVRPVAEGVIPDEGYKACLAPLFNLGRTFVTRPTLDNTVDHVGTRGEFDDSGVTILEFAGRQYRGFRLQLNVTEKAT